MADTRVTQAGRQVAIQEAADTRVTQAGRQVAIQQAADTRVTQAGRQVALQVEDGDLRVTMMGRVVMTGDPIPSKPVLITPVSGGIYSTSLAVQWTASTDPLGRDIVYNARYKPAASGTWTDIFVSKATVETVIQDISGDTDGTYDFEMWAVTDDVDAAASPKNSFQITIHNGIPTEPNITAPYEGQQWQQTTNTVEWDAATDPDMDTLNYYGQYRLVGAGSWTSLFGPQTGLTYAWNQTALAVGDYELEVWAEDSFGAGPADHVYFSIFIADEPLSTRLRITAISDSSVTAELEEYAHPFSRAWQATQWQLIPWDGDFSNPIVDYTTTDATEQLEYTFGNLPPGFRGTIRARFQDNVNTYGQWSGPAYFTIPLTSSDWERRWERNAGWNWGGLGIRGTAGEWPTTGYYAQPISGLIDPDSEAIGSYFITGYMMAGGCYCGWIGRDTELQNGGIGVMTGDSERGEQYGLFFGIDFGISAGGSGITGSHTVAPYLFVQFDPDDGCTAYGASQYFTQYGADFIGYSQVTEGVQPQFGQPIGPWVSQFTHYPIYKLELWVQRNIAAGTTRIRGRINYEGFVEGIDPSQITQKKAIGDQWDIDTTINCITPCAFPGYYRQQWAYAWTSSYIDFFGLTYTALRDEGLEVVVNVPPLNLTDLVDPPCVVVTEDALAAPVLFPVPPNGEVLERWNHPSDIIVARDDSEQRISLRDKPVQEISFTMSLLSSREVSHLKGLLWEYQATRWAIPLWMDTCTLETTLPVSSGTLPAGYADTANRRFEECDYVALWVDQFTYDLLPATINPDGSLTFTGTTSREYAAWQTQVIPCRIGRMPGEVEFDRLAPELGDINVTFILEAVDDG